jgi:hypothetical protein
MAFFYAQCFEFGDVFLFLVSSWFVCWGMDERNYVVLMEAGAGLWRVNSVLVTHVCYLLMVCLVFLYFLTDVPGLILKFLCFVMLFLIFKSNCSD